jgi:hypothetical protein
MDTSRMPDRLNYSTEAQQLVKKIDDINYMGLGVKEITRSELFLFAMFTIIALFLPIRFNIVGFRPPKEKR